MKIHHLLAIVFDSVCVKKFTSIF